MFCSGHQKEVVALKRSIEMQQAELEAIRRSMAVIEFDMDGQVLAANDNFLDVMGYSLTEVLGRHHRMFVEANYAHSAEYADFWRRLNAGEFVRERFKRIAKGGKVVWIEASYNAILDEAGRPVKVVKYATDITQQVFEAHNAVGQIAAINRSMAVIEFDLQGNILCANDNFLVTVGYLESEVVGKHHSMFVDNVFARSDDYREFWRRLSSGNFFSGTFKRLGKGGKPVWIEASYNPIMDESGKPYKVVKYATDISTNPNARLLQSVIADVDHTLTAIAGGDLTARMNGDYRSHQDSMFYGLIMQLGSVIQTMAEKLEGSVSQASTIAHNVSNVSSQVAHGASDLSARVQEQAAALEETSATMHQMTVAVQTNTDNASRVASLSAKAQQQAEDGVMVMQQTIEAMQSIKAASSKISDIVSIIDSIAFQTNLLALNAAVEAARAGEHGRGFAVVASEVRALAGKSANAAKDIKQLILDSVERVDRGTELADRSGLVLNEISGSISQVAEMIEAIAAASREQSVGIGQVQLAINDIDRVTQENAALVEETTAAAESLSNEARHLRDEMSFFKISSMVTSFLKERVQDSPIKVAPSPQKRSNALPGPDLINSESVWRHF